MKTFGKTVAIFLIFFIGTLSLIHADRQCGQMTGNYGGLEETIEKGIEK